MELQDPRQLALAANVTALLADVDEELAGFRALGEFPPEVQAEIQRSFLPERISDTLNIEGIRVNPRITRAILEGLTLAESDRYTEQEVLNVIAANELIESDAREHMPLTLDLIRELHRRVEDTLIPTAGSLREQDVSITGAAQQPPHWADLRGLLMRFCELYEMTSDIHPLVRAVWVHATFTSIHPFMDGNGRTGRLLQDFALISNGFLPVGIPASRRSEYYDALEAADDGDWRALVEIVANSELTALDRARRIAEAPERRRARVRDLLQAAQTTVRQRDYNRYEVWRRRIEGIRDEFARWVEDLNEAAGDLHIRARTYDPISFEKWSEMRERGRVSGTWILSLTFSVRRRPVYTFLLYARRHEFSYAHDVDPVEHGMVAVYLTGADEPEARYEFGRYADPYVALRELLYVDDSLRVYRDPSVRQPDDLPEGVAASIDARRWGCDEGLTLADVVEEFFTDALCKLGLIQ
jgi:Fic family protein